MKKSESKINIMKHKIFTKNQTENLKDYCQLQENKKLDLVI
jgi:hypothetical protein